jgi:hypothetical protein
MAAKKSDDRIEVVPHSELARLNADGVDIAGLIALAGYAGAAPKEGVVRLHPGLEDLSVSLDIAAADIVATRDAPVSTMPLGGVIVWVARTAEVTFRRTRTVAASAQQVRGFFGAGAVLEPSNKDDDRLNIQVRPVARKGVPPVYLPPDQCAVCHSQNCASHCLPPCTSHV